MELLERDGALSALAEAHRSATRGDGRVVFVTGEPGIGKTALVSRFVRGLGEAARVLLGTCDDLAIPRPLGPLRDLVGSVSGALADALAAGAPPHDVQALLLAELELPPRPTVLVLEDVHWADDATLDAITVLGRRIASLPALLVVTFRAGEVPRGHPLHAAVGAIRAEDAVTLELSPLSPSAVAALAGEGADDVFALTAGNPFYVTELLAARPDAELPPSVANAVRARAARLDDASRRLLELVSVVPGRVSTSLLDRVLPEWPAAAEEPERRGLLDVDARWVRFRHELARNAIRSSLPSAARRRLHGEILAALLATDADPADVVHHAEAAGASDVVADFALVAARRAAALDSNREAYSHYRRAADFVERLEPAERAAVLEELAGAAYLVDRVDEAFAAIGRAIEIWRELGDEAAVGRCTQVLSGLHRYAGDGKAARETALEAIATLEPLGESTALAAAYSGLSQLTMLAEEFAEAIEWGGRALGLATRLGADGIRAHALVNTGSACIDLDPAEAKALEQAHAFADAAGERHEAARALGNLAYAHFAWVEPAAALGYAERAVAYAREHEVHTLAAYAETTIAWLRLRAGDWEEAERLRRLVASGGSSISKLVAGTVIAELAARRGDEDTPARLAELRVMAERTVELQRIAPLLELETEWALTHGERPPAERFEAPLAEIARRGRYVGWAGARVVAWAAVAGVETELTPRMAAPHAAMALRDWRGAADAFGEVGWEYDRALMLSLLDDEQALAEALATARGLGAEPLARRAATRLRALGFRVPQGPRRATLVNPAGLTPRQLEVLALVADGLTNAEIAERLVVSPRTAEHHVAAVLTKLGAATRRDAARRASELGLVAR